MQLHGLPRPENGLLAGQGPLSPHSKLYQHSRHTVAGAKVFVHHQRPQSYQFPNLLRVFTGGL